jgi:hypothetical protein
MTNFNFRSSRTAVSFCILLAIAGCSTGGVVNGVVDTTGFVTKTAVNGTIGAGKMVTRGLSGSDDN